MSGPLHVCVGFYLDGSYRINIVRDEDLADNIDYNRTLRPGRFYFVDGKYACGGVLKPEPQADFIRQCEKRLIEMAIPEPIKDSRPYV